MPVTTPHAAYVATAPDWHKIRDVIGGEKAVKTAGIKYLPRLSDQSMSEYRAYMSRALFFNATARTVQGLLGAIFRKDSMAILPETLLLKSRSITFDNKPLNIFSKVITEEIITMGRFGILVDMDSEPSDSAVPYLAGYRAEQIINWQTMPHQGRARLTLIVLKEGFDEIDGKDIFQTNTITQYRVLSLDENGLYIQTLFRENKRGEFTQIQTIQPTFRGKPFDFIPFVFIAPTGLSEEIEKSPILDLVNVNLSHYRSSADLEHGRHFTALPTPYVTATPGTSDADNTYKIGPSNVWLLEPGGQAGMLEFKGAGLSFIENACKDKERMMAVLGARLLEEQKNGVEAAEAIRLRHAGESSVLASLAASVSEGITQSLQYWSLWQGEGAAHIKIDLNRDFLSARMAPAELQSIVAAWQAGAISFDVLQKNLEKGEVI